MTAIPFASFAAVPKCSLVQPSRARPPVRRLVLGRALPVRMPASRAHTSVRLPRPRSGSSSCRRTALCASTLAQERPIVLELAVSPVAVLRSAQAPWLKRSPRFRRGTSSCSRTALCASTLAKERLFVLEVAVAPVAVLRSTQVPWLKSEPLDVPSSQFFLAARANAQVTQGQPACAYSFLPARRRRPAKPSGLLAFE